MSTVRLYHENPYMQDFSAMLTAQAKEKNRWKVSLDRTCFYPEGGGQPCDTGTLNGIPVVDVKKEGDEIHHYLKDSIDGERINGEICRERRHDYMQQHTGQHIISAVLWNGMKISTLSVHMGESYTSIETDMENFNEKQKLFLEEEVNKLITANKKIITHNVPAGDLQNFVP